MSGHYQERVRSADPPRNLHVKAGSPSGAHIVDAPQFYRDVAAAFANAHEVLATGPSPAKAEFVEHIHKHAPGLMERIAGVGTLDRMTDHQPLAEARRSFARADRLRPQLG